jgi:hypothetical protein
MNDSRNTALKTTRGISNDQPQQTQILPIERRKRIWLMLINALTRLHFFWQLTLQIQSVRDKDVRR